ncbi:hypothetical protein LA76x_4979 [Lysobacter antibioticus]|uniref:Uncharacterized protein n=1 Tax=Lysobacter antibioticus TaxID=84531 RepID=A0A0S2FHN9_LYSAN|nr:hypothetical protein LA76x_4979 [Lysobacter antibioticus]
MSDSSVPARVDVKANGEVLVSQPGAGVLGWLSLDAVAFYPDP